MAATAGLRDRFWVELGLATATGALTVLTLVWHDWIELVFRVDPDNGSGLLEWAIVVGLALATAVSGLLARAEWRHARTEPTG